MDAGAGGARRLPAPGFARIRCDACAHEYLLAFSCKSRHESIPVSELPRQAPRRLDAVARHHAPGARAAASSPTAASGPMGRSSRGPPTTRRA